MFSWNSYLTSHNIVLRFSFIKWQKVPWHSLCVLRTTFVAIILFGALQLILNCVYYNKLYLSTKKPLIIPLLNVDVVN